mgnify:CR=1 FL=1
MREKHTKLFLTGPVEVRQDVLDQMSKPMIGHRTPEFKELFRRVTGKLQTLLHTRNRVFLSSSSAMGIMEACVRNCVRNKSLNLINGAFGERWADVVVACDKACEKYEVEWGQKFDLNYIDQRLASGEFDCLCMVHNDTSVGTINPIEEISKIVKKYPEVLFLVDSVTSMAGVKLEVDKLGIDVTFASNHKCFSLAPIMTVFCCSDRALERSKEMKGKGYYFDFQLFLKHHEKSGPLVSPPIPQIYALDYQLDKMFAEGLENRYKRHEDMGKVVREWAIMNGFEIFPASGQESPTVSCIKNTRGVDVVEMIERVKKNHGMAFSNGYRAIGGKTFRIGHLGDVTVEEVKELLKALEEEINNG